MKAMRKERKEEGKQKLNDEQQNTVSLSFRIHLHPEADGVVKRATVQKHPF
jgi:hypothetical protein